MSDPNDGLSPQRPESELGRKLNELEHLSKSQIKQISILKKQIDLANQTISGLNNQIEGEDALNERVSIAISNVSEKSDEISRAFVTYLRLKERFHKSTSEKYSKVANHFQPETKNSSNQKNLRILEIFGGLILTLFLVGVAYLQFESNQSQNSILSDQSKSQSYLIEIDRNSNYNAYLFEIISIIDKEIIFKTSKKPRLSDSAIDRAVLYASALQPYFKYENGLKTDILESTQRGMLLCYILNAKMCDESKRELLESINFDYAFIDNAVFANSEIRDLSITGLRAGKIEFSQSRLGGFSLLDPIIEHLVVTNFCELNRFELIGGEIVKVQLENSSATRLFISDCGINELVADKMKIEKSTFLFSRENRGIQFFDFHDGDILEKNNNHLALENIPKKRFMQSIVELNESSELLMNVKKSDTLVLSESLILSADNLIFDGLVDSLQVDNSVFKYKDDRFSNLVTRPMTDKEGYMGFNLLGEYSKIDNVKDFKSMIINQRRN